MTFPQAFMTQRNGKSMCMLDFFPKETPFIKKVGKKIFIDKNHPAYKEYIIFVQKNFDWFISELNRLRPGLESWRVNNSAKLGEEKKDLEIIFIEEKSNINPSSRGKFPHIL